MLVVLACVTDGCLWLAGKARHTRMDLTEIGHAAAGGIYGAKGREIRGERAEERRGWHSNWHLSRERKV